MIDEVKLRRQVLESACVCVPAVSAICINPQRRRHSSVGSASPSSIISTMIKAGLELMSASGVNCQGCQMAKFDPFLSLDCAGLESRGVQSKEEKGSSFAS